MNNKITAKDFFLHLGAIVAFYASAIALITLLFEAINFAYPQINSYNYYFPSISFQVATLIVAFPLFVWLSYLMQKAYEANPDLRESALRKWLSYITLFVAGAVVAGDLVTVIYFFLDGQELTTGFLLKVLTLVVIASGIFLYYLREIRNMITPGERNVWRIVSVVIIIGSIILGFSVIGSPQTQRERRYDSERANDLQSIQWQVVNYYQQKASIPATLELLNDPLSGFEVPVDPETGTAYEYRVIGQSALAFELCANFSQESLVSQDNYLAKPMMYEPSISARYPETWEHGSGRTCFSRSIDPQLYPVRQN